MGASPTGRQVNLNVAKRADRNTKTVSAIIVAGSGGTDWEVRRFGPFATLLTRPSPCIAGRRKSYVNGINVPSFLISKVTQGIEMAHLGDRQQTVAVEAKSEMA